MKSSPSCSAMISARWMARSTRGVFFMTLILPAGSLVCPAPGYLVACASVQEMAPEAPALALVRTVADRLQLESVRIKPVGRKTVWPVPGELTGFVEDDGVACTSPLVCVPDDGSARDQECEVMKPCLKT